MERAIGCFRKGEEFELKKFSGHPVCGFPKNPYAHTPRGKRLEKMGGSPSGRMTFKGSRQRIPIRTWLSMKEKKIIAMRTQRGGGKG